MTDVIDRLVVAMNAHDLDAVAGFIHEDYRSEQSAYPGRAFAGRAQMLANWEAMFAGIPGFHAEICRSVQDGEMTWTSCCRRRLEKPRPATAWLLGGGCGARPGHGSGAGHRLSRL